MDPVSTDDTSATESGDERLDGPRGGNPSPGRVGGAREALAKAAHQPVTGSAWRYLDRELTRGQTTFWSVTG